jgi:hypothetical protein
MPYPAPQQPGHQEADGLGIDDALLLPVHSTADGHLVLEPACGSCACAARRVTWPDGAGNRRDAARRSAARVDRRVLVQHFELRGLQAEVMALHDRCVCSRMLLCLA